MPANMAGGPDDLPTSQNTGLFYLDLFRALVHHRVEYALIGGLAVALHGVERNTMDIDISVVMSPDVAGVPVRLASVQDLIALKAAVARPIDLADIEHLKRLPSA